MSYAGVEEAFDDATADDRVDVELDPELRRAAARFNRRSRWTLRAVQLLLYAMPVYAVVRSDGYLLLLASAVVIVVFHTRGLETQSHVTLATEKSPADVRSEFASLVNPVTVTLVANVDEVRTVDGDDDLAVELAYERRLRPPRVLPLGVSETDDGEIQIHVGAESAGMVATASVEPTDEGTRVDVSSSRTLAPLQLPGYWVESRSEEPLLAHFGYREVAATVQTRLDR